MDYQETIELEENVKIKNRADKIYRDFMLNIKLDVNSFKNGRFTLWKDSHNATYLEVNNNGFVYVCDFLHENYSLNINPSSIFDAIKNDYNGLGHLESHITIKKNKNKQD